MFVVASRVLSDFSPALKHAGDSLYPALENVREISRQVAIAVGREAMKTGLARDSKDSIEDRVDKKMWQPHYVTLST